MILIFYDYFGCTLFILDVDNRLCITGIIKQFWGYKVEEKLHLGGREPKKGSIPLVYSPQTASGAHAPPSPLAAGGSQVSGS
jgi:hypothetical protein